MSFGRLSDLAGYLNGMRVLLMLQEGEENRNRRVLSYFPFIAYYDENSLAPFYLLTKTVNIILISSLIRPHFYINYVKTYAPYTVLDNVSRPNS